MTRTPPTPARRAVRRAAGAPPEWLRRFRASLSTPGLLVGTLLFAVSLAPSLLPRGWVMQGILSGFSVAAGYAIGVGYRWLWGYLELPLPGGRTQRRLLWVAAGVCAAVAFGFLWQASEWQNAVRRVVELEPVDTARPFRVGFLAFFVFAVLLGVARLFHFAFRVISERLGRGIPRRVANLIALVAVAMLFWSVIDGVVVRSGLRFADATFQKLDAQEEADAAAPTDPLRTGSGASLVAWQDLGRTGRGFVSATPTPQELGRFSGEEGRAPIRVYVGLNAADTPEERARLALAELERVGGFERAVLVIVIPTGTGWIDPSSITTLEFLHRGDVASVAVQYSYLPSWLTLLTAPLYGAETADALFDAVYGRWTELEPDDRPALFLHGVSLGALNSEQSADLYDVIGDPLAGALWAGPPFRSETWRTMTREREPGSPAWLPRFRDGSVVRFMNQYGASHPPETPWGPLRIVYLQYGSDPITFFEPETLFRRPQWLDEPRAPDVSRRVRWYPLVTMMHLMADLAVGDTSPSGYGHVFAPEHYIDAWLAVTDPSGWPDAEVRRLKEHFADGG